MLVQDDPYRAEAVIVLWALLYNDDHQQLCGMRPGNKPAGPMLAQGDGCMTSDMLSHPDVV